MPPIIFAISMIFLIRQSCSVSFSPFLDTEGPGIPLTDLSDFAFHGIADITDTPPSSPAKDLSDDCLESSLEYLGNGTDLQNFRRACRHFNRIYNQYKVRQNANFQCFDMLFANTSPQNIYRSLDKLLNSVPMIPDVYVEFWDDEQYRHNFSYSLDFHALITLQSRSKHYILRGLSTTKKNAFLSILLFNDVDWNMDPMLLAIWFDNKTMLTAACQNNAIPYHPTNFSVTELNMLLHRKRVRLFGSISYETHPNALWTIGKRRCSAHVRYAFCGTTRLRRAWCTIQIFCCLSFGIVSFAWWVPVLVCLGQDSCQVNWP